MRKFKILPLLLLLLTMATSVAAQKKTQKTYIPWNNGKLVVSEEGRYLKHENGTPFFWMGETGWLLPERLNRDEAEYYLEQCKRRGYNVIQVQTLNNVPSMNIYGQYSMIDGYNFKNINQKGVYGYWDHMDYIIRTAAKKGQYIGMVCIWGSPVNRGEMTVHAEGQPPQLGSIMLPGWISTCSKADTAATDNVSEMVTILSKKIRKKTTGVL